MKLSITLVAALLCAAAPALAQAPAQHQPGVAAPRQAPAPSAVSPAAPPSLSEKVDPAKEAAIRHLMDVTETSKLGDNINSFLTDRIRTIMSRSMAPDKLPKFMDSFTQKFSASSPSSAVTDAMVPIYARAFTMEDIQEMTKFYESSVGQKMVKQLPQVTQESQNTGVQIEQNAAMSVLDGMQEEYPELKPMLHPQEPAPGAGAPGTGAPGAQPSPEGPPPQK
ncbi:MAG TPA: DUF2059 domain-containing protein [Candidatus Acidoferrales bacterium]|jgi:hypothetical protein|nr:DUF2059 domain-containing protein [Candidatus Acidoferrales bacterium]